MRHSEGTAALPNSNQNQFRYPAKIIRSLRPCVWLSKQRETEPRRQHPPRRALLSLLANSVADICALRSETPVFVGVAGGCGLRTGDAPGHLL